MEIFRGGKGSAAEWREYAGEQYPRLRTFLRDTGERVSHVPCPTGCGCYHDVVDHGGGELVGVCCCDPWNCDDLAVTPDQIAALEVNAPKLGRAVGKAFECEAREMNLPMHQTWQVGVKFADAMPVFLTIPDERDAFERTVRQLTARHRQRFILAAPTASHMDANSRELLESVGAGFIALENYVTLTPQGNLHTRTPPAELFARFAPEAKEPVAEDVARTAFGLIEALESTKRMIEPSVLKVFRLYCMKEMTTDQIAQDCGCAKGTVINRLERIQKATGMDPNSLKRLSPHLQKIEDDANDSRARHIHRKDLVDDADDPDDFG
jgi:hypothetical protein